MRQRFPALDLMKGSHPESFRMLSCYQMLVLLLRSNICDLESSDITCEQVQNVFRSGPPTTESAGCVVMFTAMLSRVVWLRFQAWSSTLRKEYRGAGGETAGLLFWSSQQPL
jgi:hypothetical protein